MYTITTYGVWLQGDSRGWVKNGIVFPVNPPLQARNRAIMKHPPFYFDKQIRPEVGSAMCEALTSRLGIVVLAMCVQAWHSHFVTAATRDGVEEVVKCAKDAVRWKLLLDRPIWGDGYDKRFCFDNDSVRTRIRYVERHNERDGLPQKHWSFIKSYRDVI